MYLDKLFNKLSKNNKRLLKKNKNSKNYKKFRLKIAKLKTKIYRIRINYLHKLTHNLVLNNKIIAIEDFNLKTNLNNRHFKLFAINVLEFRRQLEYKAKLYSSKIIKVNKFYPSSKLCNICGYKNQNLTLNQRTWNCICGAMHDRDINAAINLKNIVSTVSCTGI